jgi:DNA adenine methylase
MKDWKKLKKPSSQKIVSRPDPAPFKWAGSKNKMFKKYYDCGFFISEEPSVFIDMFSGSGCVALWVKQNYPNTDIIINDKCQELTDMFKNMKSKTYSKFEAEYISHVKNGYDNKSVTYRKEYYYDLRNKYTQGYNSMSQIEQSAGLFYMLQTGFNGIWQTSKNFNFRYATACGIMTWKCPGKIFDLSRIQKFSQFIDTCTILSDDYQNTSVYAKKGAWFYADPPYRSSKGKYRSAGKFTDINHEQLCDFLVDVNSKDCHVALSNREIINDDWSPDDEDIDVGWFSDKFGDDFNVVYHKVKYTAGRHNRGAGSNSTEVLIRNYV